MGSEKKKHERDSPFRIPGSLNVTSHLCFFFLLLKRQHFHWWENIKFIFFFWFVIDVRPFSYLNVIELLNSRFIWFFCNQIFNGFFFERILGFVIRLFRDLLMSVNWMSQLFLSDSFIVSGFPVGCGIRPVLLIVDKGHKVPFSSARCIR